MEIWEELGIKLKVMEKAAKIKEILTYEFFEKNLLFLIQFYIFSYESRFVEYNRDKGMLTLPCSTNITEEEHEKVAKAVNEPQIS